MSRAPWISRWLGTPRSAALALAFLIGLALLGTVLTGTAEAAYPGGDGLIAFVRGGNIYTIDPGRLASAVKLTADGHDSGPRWSPDGQQIAYVHRGNLWVMNATGSHKKRLTSTAPAYAASRPSWSPNGHYLAFVLTKRGRTHGYLTRYSLSARSIRYFTTTINGHLIRVAARPAPVAWAWAVTTPQNASHGSYLAYEGAGALCPFADEYCLNLLGFPSQSGYKNGFPSDEEGPTMFRLTDPDWYPQNPLYYQDLMTSQENCSGGHCAPVGLDLTIGATPAYLGGYDGVYSPSGGLFAYVVDNRRGKPRIYLGGPPRMHVRLTTGSEPDWQPVPAGRPLIRGER
ncbi:MAG TPA: DPP IV N-terminal domain-containing protein [Streptosporangiaceae bacterium]|nr:DPP IV N-terminal domain-containing protein [Streptosporangiaceae bacterium]